MGRKEKQKARTAPEPLTPERVIRMRQRRLSDWEDVKSFFTRLIWLAVVLYILFGQLFGVTRVADNDMSPRLSSGDILLYYRLEKSFLSQDLVVLEKDDRQYVGRVIAKGGESVEITEDARVKINGSTVNEPDIYYSTPRYVNDIIYPVTLAYDECFILCDYRESAIDSRTFGPVKGSEIKGKVIGVLRRSNL